ncbi:hypothetical protein TEA_000632 [Camellia sinensis var. sinensis]|uniref:Uncharacterized protein n=1 Tax=Camellia sinensis var. sinensis TaxID=542762 RepID=A0A4S4ET89_CAMSN|nr:hypothetical protein TEA_000632 [Camellia sinensis var. sinensis]
MCVMAGLRCKVHAVVGSGRRVRAVAGSGWSVLALVARSRWSVRVVEIMGLWSRQWWSWWLKGCEDGDSGNLRKSSTKLPGTTNRAPGLSFRTDGKSSNIAMDLQFEERVEANLVRGSQKVLYSDQWSQPSRKKQLIVLKTFEIHRALGGLCSHHSIRSALEQKKIDESKEYRAIDYDAPVESDPSTTGLSTKIGIGGAIVVFGLVFALGDFLPTGRTALHTGFHLLFSWTELQEQNVIVPLRRPRLSIVNAQKKREQIFRAGPTILAAVHVSTNCRRLAFALRNSIISSYLQFALLSSQLSMFTVCNDSQSP